MPTMNYVYTFGQIELDCQLEYLPSERETDIDPAYPAQAVLISAKAGGVDISPLLDNRIVAMIEEGAVWSMQS